MKPWFLVLTVVLNWLARGASAGPVVVVEEDVYSFTDAGNGAGPMWCHGSTCLVRTGERIFASGLETMTADKPLNNCRWLLFERGAEGWDRVWADDGRTREPAPVAAFPDGRLFVSVNPTLGEGPEPNGGPARPDILEFDAAKPKTTPKALKPIWTNAPHFTEHSYRSLASDPVARELILFQNIGYTHAEWTFQDRTGRWSAQGQLKWPWGAEYDNPEPIRVCYPNVALRNRAVYFCGVSDVVEPYKAWREYKRQLTGKEWDYDFRRLFFTWTPDITREPFSEWVEISSRDKTCGWIMPGDLYVAPKGEVHLVWSERALDERLRARFFPEAKQSQSLNYAVVRKGKVVHRQILEESAEGKPGVVGSNPRFHVTPDQRLFVVYYASGSNPEGKAVSENRVCEIAPGGQVGTIARLPLTRPFVNFFTATMRSGSPASYTLDLLGQRAETPLTVSYACIRLQ